MPYELLRPNGSVTRGPTSARLTLCASYHPRRPGRLQYTKRLRNQIARPSSTTSSGFVAQALLVPLLSRRAHGIELIIMAGDPGYELFWNDWSQGICEIDDSRRP